MEMERHLSLTLMLLKAVVNIIDKECRVGNWMYSTDPMPCVRIYIVVHSLCAILRAWTWNEITLTVAGKGDFFFKSMNPSVFLWFKYSKSQRQILSKGLFLFYLTVEKYLMRIFCTGCIYFLSVLQHGKY
jgi:hypothetical protein